MFLMDHHVTFFGLSFGPFMKTVLCREEQAYLVGVAGLKDVTGHLGLGVVGLAPQEIGKIGEVIAVVNEARYELCFVLEYEH